MTTHSPSFASTYPPEIVEWVEALDSDDLNEQLRRAIAILEDDEVMKAAKTAIPTLLADVAQWQDEDRLSRLDGFWTFVTEAAALPDQQPPGAHLHAPGEAPIFSTPAQLREDITEAAAEALALADRLTRIATTIQGEMPISAALHAIDTLDAIHSACLNTAHHHAPDKQAHGVPDIPLPGSTAGVNAWGDWLLARLDTLASIHLRGTYSALTQTVQSAIIVGMTERAEPARYEIKGTPAFSIAM